ncbi:hypothetical protein GJ496_004041 [Pomphorhynchus laevis]|nr:hypothetical protein GJ496_004041 [Pomphorhynchus laevis]
MNRSESRRIFLATVVGSAPMLVITFILLLLYSYSYVTEYFGRQRLLKLALLGSGHTTCEDHSMIEDSVIDEHVYDDREHSFRNESYLDSLYFLKRKFNSAPLLQNSQSVEFKSGYLHDFDKSGISKSVVSIISMERQYSDIFPRYLDQQSDMLD